MKTANLKAIIYLVFTCIFLTSTILGQQTDINGPAGSGSFGTQVVALPNGNIVITDPSYSIPSGAANVGAFYLYDGSNGNLISTITGSTENDQVGIGGVTVLTNGNFVVGSRLWNGTAQGAGAVTFGNGTTGVSGVVSSTNSLVGSTQFDNVGNGGITVLTNGNYVVSSTLWNGTAVSAGAVTFGNGTNGTTGAVSASNSLVGSTAGDRVGFGSIAALPNGNYVFSSPNWDSAAVDVGAVTFGNGTNGISGSISASNSLIGSTEDDRVGNAPITVLPNSNYVVRSRFWNGTAEEVGAVTFGNGTTGTIGVVSQTNSLVGSTQFDNVGILPIVVLTNGNYVVGSPIWNGAEALVGAVTFGNGTTGISGVVSSNNSLVGSTELDNVGIGSITALANGNYVVSSPRWDGAAVDVGAVTLGNGTTGISGVVSSENSLVGSTESDQVGNNSGGNSGVTALTNGNYVVISHLWNSTANDVGAVTFGNGTSGITGVITPTNSLVGSSFNDQIGNAGVTALTNGNYVVSSTSWDNTIQNVGAITFGNGTSGITGVVSTSNSLVGSSGLDQIGNAGVTALTNGNYVVSSTLWDNAGMNIGAATFGNGTTGTIGVVSASNSLVGSTPIDQVGARVTSLANGNYVVGSPIWDGAAVNIGAVTFGNGTNGTTGAVSSANSLVGLSVNDRIGDGGITDVGGGYYVVRSPLFDNGMITDAGAISYFNSATGEFAPLAKNVGESKKNGLDKQFPPTENLAISMSNSVFGTTAGGGSSMTFSFDQANDQLIVGRPADNIVTIFKRSGMVATNVSVEGRVLNANGIAIPNATVSITASGGEPFIARSNSFGFFKFESVPSGEIYNVGAFAKGYIFTPQVLSVNKNVTGLEITAQ